MHGGGLLSWPKPLPEGMKVAKAEPDRYLNLSRMQPEEKRATWQEIKRRNPALAELLRDPILNSLREAFDADVLIDPETLDRAMEDMK